MLKIGLTGGIGSGKSTIAKIIATLGYPVYISDFKASELINRDEEIKKHLIELFGKDIYQPDGSRGADHRLTTRCSAERPP